MIHNKAIRDKIPEIIEKSGSKCNVKTLSDSEFLAELEKKLGEEVSEYQESKSLEELADILEVINRILEIKEIPKEKLEEIRIMKKDERGGFEKNLFLVDTFDREIDSQLIKKEDSNSSDDKVLDAFNKIKSGEASRMGQKKF